MNDLLKQIVDLAATVFAPKAAVWAIPIMNGIIDSLQIQQSQGVAKVSAVAMEHLKRFEAAIVAAQAAEQSLQGQLEHAARHTFELGLSRALRDMGYLQMVGGE